MQSISFFPEALILVLYNFKKRYVMDMFPCTSRTVHTPSFGVLFEAQMILLFNFFIYFFGGGRLIFAPIRKSLLLDNRSKRPGGKNIKTGFFEWKASVNQNITARHKNVETSKHSSSRISKFQFCSSLIPKVRKKLINDTLNINSDYSVSNKHLSLPILGKHLW